MQNEKTEDEQFTQVGERLAMLLAAANMPQDVKAAWAELVPEMSLEQMDKFAKALEANIAGAADPDLQKLTDSVEMLKARREEEKQAATQKAQQSLDEIERLLADN